MGMGKPIPNMLIPRPQPQQFFSTVDEHGRLVWR